MDTGRDGLTVFSRKGCHLCEVLIEELLPQVRGRLEVRIHDVDSRPDWREAYGERVPVVEYRGEALCEYRLDHRAVAKLLADLSAS